MKKKYLTPEMEIIEFETEDVITDSTAHDDEEVTDDDDEGTGDGE